MSRLDNLGEILDGYKGREYTEVPRNPVAELRERLSEKACTVYDSLNPELQQNIAKYVEYVEQTGIIKGMEDEGLVEMPLADFPEFMEEYLLGMEEAPDEATLAEFTELLDNILKSYEGQ